MVFECGFGFKLAFVEELALCLEGIIEEMREDEEG